MGPRVGTALRQGGSAVHCWGAGLLWLHLAVCTCQAAQLCACIPCMLPGPLQGVREDAAAQPQPGG